MKLTLLNPGLSNHFNRRNFLKTTSLAIAGATIAHHAGDYAFAQTFAANPFTLGVASGEPLPDGIVLWTRLAPDPLNGGGLSARRKYAVEWQIARDENMQQVVQQGAALAIPELGHSVHVEVTGLDPSTIYWYRFTVRGHESTIGRTRTAPATGARTDELKFAFASCSDWQYGLFAAYGAMAREDVDLIIHLGDYIYEYGAAAGGPRQHTGAEVDSLESYRNRHALYKTDLNLQAAHAAAPWLVTWDDHEVENNYANLTREENATPANQDFANRRANAYQAYYENMPLRLSSLPRGIEMDLYRRVTFGDLIDFNVLDTRQYRTDQPCGDSFRARCADAFDPNATLLGYQQEQWLANNLLNSQSRWNVLAQQVMMAQFDFRADSIPDSVLDPVFGPGKQAYNLDQWDGYVAARNRLFNILQGRAAQLNPVVITGDIHSSWAHDLKLDFDNPSSETVGTEFITTSISAQFPAAFIQPIALAVSENPHTKFFDGANRGYVRCRVNQAQWQTDFRVVPTLPNGQVVVDNAEATTKASYIVEAGRPGAVRL